MKPLAGLATCPCASVIAGEAHAGPWMRGPGQLYANLSLSTIGANALYGLDFNKVPINPYRQVMFGGYAEVGVVDRWLTVSVESQLYRINTLLDVGRTAGPGDARVGLWTGLLTAPLHLSAAILVGIPTGDPEPEAGAGTPPGSTATARSLPTGDGEFDVEARVSAGDSFGGGSWPLRHFAVAELGYWKRTKCGRCTLNTDPFKDAIAYRVELGSQLPLPIADRFWLILRLSGVESFASQDDVDAAFTGLGNGLTFTSYGLELVARLWAGLGLGAGFDGAFRARGLAAGSQLRVTLSYER